MRRLPTDTDPKKSIELNILHAQFSKVTSPFCAEDIGSERT